MRSGILSLKTDQRYRHMFQLYNTLRRISKTEQLAAYSLILFLSGFLSVFLSGNTYADAGWTEAAPVIEVNPTAKHFYQFRLLDIESPADCKQKNGFYQDYKDRGADQIYQALLEAISANLNVKVFVTGGCNLKGFAEVSSVIITR